jgi:DNA polymerase
MLEDVYLDYQADPAFRELRMNARFVPGVGQRHRPILFVGEAPGRNENSQGIPFVGAAGRVLNEALALHGIRRDEDTFITNVVKYRPPNNRDPLPEEKTAAIPYLRREWHVLMPATTVLLGRHACETILGDRELPGTVLDRSGSRFVVTLHPAACLYRPELRERFQHQIGLVLG